MKIISIESPHRVKGGIGKATVTVKREDFMALVVLGDEAFEGKEIELDVRKSDKEPEHDSIWEFAQRQARELDLMLRQEIESAYETGVQVGKQAITSDEVVEKIAVVYDSPERQADVIKAHDTVKVGDRDRY